MDMSLAPPMHQEPVGMMNNNNNQGFGNQQSYQQNPFNQGPPPNQHQQQNFGQQQQQNFGNDPFSNNNNNYSNSDNNTNSDPKIQKVKNDLTILKENIDKADNLIRSGNIRNNRELDDLMSNITMMDNKLQDLVQKLNSCGEHQTSDYAKMILSKLKETNTSYQNAVNRTNVNMDFSKPALGDFSNFTNLGKNPQQNFAGNRNGDASGGQFWNSNPVDNSNNQNVVNNNISNNNNQNQSNKNIEIDIFGDSTNKPNNNTNNLQNDNKNKTTDFFDI